MTYKESKNLAKVTVKVWNGTIKGMYVCMYFFCITGVTH